MRIPAALLPPQRAAIIGCGAIAYEHLPFLASCADVELVGLCDHSLAMAEAARSRFSAPAAYADAAAMLADAKPDVVHVLTPPHTHDALVRLALAAGAHVICEKPMTGSAAETAALLAAAQDAGRALIETRNLLFNDAVLDLLTAIKADRLGRVIECDIMLSLDFLAGPFGDRNLAGSGVALPGGAIHDFLPHLVYLFQMLTGSAELDDVRGHLSNHSGNPRAGFDFLDVLVSAGSLRGRLRIATDTQPDCFRVIVRGTKASLETDLYNPYQRFEGFPDIGKRAPLGLMRSGSALYRAGLANFRDKVMQHGTTHGMPRMLAAIYAAIRSGTPMPFTPEQMLATARMTDSILAAGAAA